jgi:cell shape-determining protein MreC
MSDSYFQYLDEERDRRLAESARMKELEDENKRLKALLSLSSSSKPTNQNPGDDNESE